MYIHLNCSWFLHPFSRQQNCPTGR
ncbi:hypothetical protein [Nitrospira sp. Nam80]